MLKVPNRRVRPAKTGVAAPLGDLEVQVMRYLWSCGPDGCQSTDVHHALAQTGPIALTTTLTTLERLCNKGILLREREGKLYRYRALLSEDQLQQRIVEGVMGGLIEKFPRAVAAYLAEGGVLDDDANSLDELAGLLEKLRSQRPSSEQGD